MMRYVFPWVLLLAGTCCLAQQPQPSNPSPPGQSSSSQSSSSQASPNKKADSEASSRSSSPTPDASQGTAVPPTDGNAQDDQESSSRDTRIDTSPPTDDAKNHPDSKAAVAGMEPPPPTDTTGVQEVHPWNPYKASKDVEIGDYYFRRKNYKAALDRYKEALFYKDNDAVATYRLAVCQEKLGDKAEARKNFEQYLKILPEGPLAKDARASIERLGEKRSQ